MGGAPDEFNDQFSDKGATFHEIADLLYRNHTRQFTQTEIAQEVGVSRQRVSDLLGEMEDDWLVRFENQTTYSWDIDQANPADTGLIEGIVWFYTDLAGLFRKHLKSTTGVFAILGFLLLVTSLVMLVFYLAYNAPLGPRSDIPAVVYLVIAIGAFLTGVAITALTPLQAVVNRILGSG